MTGPTRLGVSLGGFVFLFCQSDLSQPNGDLGKADLDTGAHGGTESQFFDPGCFDDFDQLLDISNNLFVFLLGFANDNVDDWSLFLSFDLSLGDRETLDGLFWLVG